MNLKLLLAVLISCSMYSNLKADDFSDAAQGLADALAQGGQLTLGTLFQYAPDQIVQTLFAIPGPFQELLKMLKFDKKPAVYIDKGNKVLVIEGQKDIGGR